MTHQISMALPEALFKKAEEYAGTYGFGNVQDLAVEALREKVFPRRK